MEQLEIDNKKVRKGFRALKKLRTLEVEALTWMTTVSLAVLGFYLTFIFNTYRIEWIRNSLVPKIGIALLVTAVSTGYVLRALLGLSEASKYMMDMYRAILPVRSKEIQLLRARTNEIADLASHSAFEKKMAAEKEDIAKDLDRIETQMKEDKEFLKFLIFADEKFKISRLLWPLLAQGVFLFMGAAIALYVFCVVVFTLFGGNGINAI